jgi:hypothetical protein
MSAMTLFTNFIAAIPNVELASPQMQPLHVLEDLAKPSVEKIPLPKIFPTQMLQPSPSVARYKTMFFISGTMASASEMGPSTALMTLKPLRTCK